MLVVSPGSDLCNDFVNVFRFDRWIDLDRCSNPPRALSIRPNHTELPSNGPDNKMCKLGSLFSQWLRMVNPAFGKQTCKLIAGGDTVVDNGMWDFRRERCRLFCACQSNLANIYFYSTVPWLTLFNIPQPKRQQVTIIHSERTYYSPH